MPKLSRSVPGYPGATYASKSGGSVAGSLTVQMSTYGSVEVPGAVHCDHAVTAK